MFEISDDDETFWENIPNAVDVPEKELPPKRQYGHPVDSADTGKKSKGSWGEGFVSLTDRNIMKYSTAVHNSDKTIASRFIPDHEDRSSIEEGFSAEGIHKALSIKKDNVSTDIMRSSCSKGLSAQSLDASTNRKMFNLTQSSDDSMDTEFHFSPVISNCINNAGTSIFNDERISEKLKTVNTLGFDGNQNFLKSAYDNTITDNRLMGSSPVSHIVNQKLVNNMQKPVLGLAATMCPETPLLFESPAAGNLNVSRDSVTHSLTTTPAVYKPCISSTENTPKSRRRVFPGPAGVLPHLNSTATSLADSPIITASVRRTSPEAQNLTNEPDLPLSQNSADMFNDKPWMTLLTDLGDDACMFLQKFSIADVLLKANRRQLSASKVSLLFTVIDNIEYQGAEAFAVLRDKTGVIQGTLHRDLLKQFETSIHIGAVMVLRQVGVISPTLRNHYLNITPSNIVVIYSKEMESNNIKKQMHGTPPSERMNHSLMSEMDIDLKSIIQEISGQQEKEQNKWDVFSMNSTTSNPSNLNSTLNSPYMTGRGEVNRFNSPSAGIMLNNRNTHNVRSTLWHGCGPQTSSSLQARTPLTGGTAHRPVPSASTPQHHRYTPVQRHTHSLQRPAAYTPQQASFTLQQPTGYTPQRPGSRLQQPTGYTPHQPTGYTPQQPTGYTPHQPTGYTPQQPGSTLQQPSGYTPQRHASIPACPTQHQSPQVSILNQRTVPAQNHTTSLNSCQNFIPVQSFNKNTDNLKSPCANINEHASSNKMNVDCSVAPCGTPTQSKTKWRFKSASPNISISSPELSPDNTLHDNYGIHRDRTNSNTNSSASHIVPKCRTSNPHSVHVRDSEFHLKATSVMTNVKCAFPQGDQRGGCKTNEQLHPLMSDMLPLTDDNFWQDDLTDELLQQIVTDDM